MEVCPMVIYATREQFHFLIDVLGSTISPTIVNKLDVTDLQFIMTPSFFTLAMFDLVITSFFSV